MARSYKKTMVAGNSLAESEKQDKRRAHGVIRAHFRTALGSCTDIDEFQFVERNEAHSQVYTFAKDGRHFQHVRAVHQGKGLKALQQPAWVRTARQLHRTCGK